MVVKKSTTGKKTDKSVWYHLSFFGEYNRHSKHIKTILKMVTDKHDLKLTKVLCSTS